MRLRTKFLLTMLLISAGLTSTSLLVVRRLVEARLRNQILQDTRNSVTTFRNAHAQREAALQSAAALMANLPILRAMMTSADPMTIQDASRDLFRLAAAPSGGRSSANLFVLADRNGIVMGVHNTGAGLSLRRAHELVSEALERKLPLWWYGANHLYQVAMRPIYFGPADDQRLLGYLFLGHEIDDSMASELKQVAASEVAFFAGPGGRQMVRSTLPAAADGALQKLVPQIFDASGTEFQIGQEPYLVTCVELAEPGQEAVHLVVLKSLREANDFVRNLDRVLLGLGMVAILTGAALVFVMSRTFTRPLDRLVAGVRALGRGDYEYALTVHGKDEVAEVTTAFDRMRSRLRQSQRELLESERLVTIGRMAGSISHDLRHHLVAIVANAEYLSDARREAERQELCEELRISAHQMTDMIDSLLELSRPRESLHLSEVHVREIIGRAIHTVRAHRQFAHVAIDISGEDQACRVDPGKLQRMLQNLIINACEAVGQQTEGRVTVDVRVASRALELRVSDNGRGVDYKVRQSAFEPFVSHGKENGTGLGLTVVQKIVSDHGGHVSIEATSPHGTTILVNLPLVLAHATPGPTETATIH
jgi:signal transduction histidine kinase